MPALAALFAAAAVWPWVAPITPPSSVAARDSAAAATVPALPPAAAFAAVSDRPLFSPSRRPPAVAAAPLAGAVAARYRLIGVIAIGGDRRALLADGPRRIEISEGGALDSWKVARIEDDRVVFSTPTGETSLILQRAAPEAVTPTPR
ncbi:MAG TPA: hypothetical protein VHW90_11495 [Stellaceae bacterium]|nr:hypothetical protein [Stellaceae bacterium]